MANDQLSTTSNSASQSTTQSPQGNAQSIDSGSNASGVQPGTANNLLNGQGSVSLHSTSLPSIKLGSLQPTAPPLPIATSSNQPKHHVNSVLLGIVLLLFVIAAAMAWSINRSSKTT